MDREAVRRKSAGLARRLGAYKYVLLVAAAGLLLLLWPKEKEEVSSVGQPEENFSVESLEEQLEEVLGRIDGAGRVSVMLTVRTGMERVLAEDSSVRTDERSAKTVVVSAGSGKQEVVLLSQRYPTFQGALVVCPGGEDARVRLQITQAVSALTGLGAGRISVCRGA